MNYHQSWTPSAKNYFEDAIDAHGGWKAWNQFASVEFKLKRFSGALLNLKGYKHSFHKPASVVVEPKKRRVGFNYLTHTDVFENGKVTFSVSRQTILDGRSLFRETTFEQWRPEHAAYFFGYAWADYIGYPFTLPEFELLNFEKAHSSVSFLIQFPEGFHTQSKIQKFYFDSRQMLYRHDYRARLAGPLVFGAHYSEGYQDAQGLQIACVRKVKPRMGQFVLPVNGIYGEIDIFS